MASGNIDVLFVDVAASQSVRDQRFTITAVLRTLLESLQLSSSVWAQGRGRARWREEPETHTRLSGSSLLVSWGFVFVFFPFLLVIFIPKVEHFSLLFFIYFLLLSFIFSYHMTSVRNYSISDQKF